MGATDAMCRRPDYDLRDDAPTWATTDGDEDDWATAYYAFDVDATIVVAVHSRRVDVAIAYPRDIFFSPIV